jgi:ribosomal protein L12E/L44/L45/RPP1/RPP2
MSLGGGMKDEYVTSLAALALYDGDAEITSDNINALLAATNNSVAPYWPSLFAGLLKGGRIETLVFSRGGGGAVSGGGGGAAASAAPGAGNISNYYFK